MASPLSPTPQPNRLIHEKSPYLLQHAYNPVDWYPWGEEAFERARRENKPILVSIGYSTCHWCHVMEKESFEDPKVAALMKQYLISIKVDREERPDIDKFYMSAVTAMTGQGGWPLNVFLTPELKPFFGGTYFPPDARWGRPSWPDMIQSIGENWAHPETRKKMLESADSLTQSLKQHLTLRLRSGQASPGTGSRPDASCLRKALEGFRAIYDSQHGGFGGAPKFPMPVYHSFLLRYYAWTRGTPSEADAGKTALEMSLNTLRMMSRGGVYDHVGGGFHRYSTDERWHVPHFEKMLYDNAQLAATYLDAFQIAKDPEFLRTARETLDYALRDLSHPGGGFYSAEDADSVPYLLTGEGPVLSEVVSKVEPRVEGAFYVWEKREIMHVLGAREGELFSQAHGVKPDGNAASDPQGEFEHKNILYRGVAPGAPESSLQKLFEARKTRPRPHLDDKIIASWNGLMITALARAFQVTGDQKYLRSAESAARFIEEKMVDPSANLLYRRWRDDERKIDGTADDYVFLAQGLLDLYEASFDPHWLEWAISLMETTLRKFYDAQGGGFYMTAEGHPESVLVRVKEDIDNVEPSASSIAVLNLLRLAVLTDRKDFREAAEKTLGAFEPQLKEHPMALPQLLAAVIFSLSKPTQVVIAGDPEGPDTREMLRQVRSRFLPNKILVLLDGGRRQQALSRIQPFLKDLSRHEGRSTAYVCVNFTCELPTTDPKVLADALH